MRHVATALAALGGVALTACVLFPIARRGVGSATPMRGLSDLILSGSLSHQLPSWAGVVGYLPGIGGALLLLSEAFGPVARLVIRVVALVPSGAVLGLFVWIVPWDSPADVGMGLQLGCLGWLLGAGALVIDLSRFRDLNLRGG